MRHCIHVAQVINIQTGEMYLIQRIDTMKSTYYRPYKYFCKRFDINVSKCFTKAQHGIAIKLFDSMHVCVSFGLGQFHQPDIKSMGISALGPALLPQL